MAGEDDLDAIACFFCGPAPDETDLIAVGAFWEQDREQREQYWSAHRACMIEYMSEFTRSKGGPLLAWQ